MNNFNKNLIDKIKLYQTEENDIEIEEEKYYFLKYIFSNLESLDANSLDICDEEFDDLGCNVDAFYFDEDNSTYNLYLAIYNDENNDYSFLDKEQINIQYNKIINFITKSLNGKYAEFGNESFTYEISDIIHKNFSDNEIVINIITNYNIPANLQKDDIEEIEGKRVSFMTYDLEDLESKFSQINSENIELNCKQKFDEDLLAIKISSTPDFDVYMTSMKGLWLANLYKEDSIRLLESNVRSYLKRTARVNAGILSTVKNNPEEFVSFNNGISAVATNIKIDKANSFSNIFKIQSIVNFQIVNGGQTTATLYECEKDKLHKELTKIIVPVKLTVVKNISNSEDLIRDISVYSNTQTAIKRSDPPSNLPYYIKIKELSKKCITTTLDNISYICYFERTNGEYNTEFKRNNGTKRFTNTNPKDKKFTKIDLANAINCWEQIPYIVSLGKEKNFILFNDNIKKLLKDPDEEYFMKAYAVIIMFNKIDKIARKMKLSYKSNVVAYTLSLISYITDKHIDLIEIWNKKELTDNLIKLVEDLLPKVHKVIEETPPEHPEARMWARKEKCWDIIKNIKTNVIINLSIDRTEFFPKNEAYIYIEDDNNFYNSVTWIKLLLWNNKYKILNKKQVNMIKYMRSIVNKETAKLSKKQIDFAKDIFILAVKQGFKYE